MSDPQAPDRIHPTLGIPWRKVPRHIAVIMDGNGRWAQKRGRPRLDGHRAGSKSVRAIITGVASLGVECLTLYSFSTENWKRPPEEVAGLMDLYREYLIAERPTIMKYGIRVRHLGDESRLPQHVLDELRETIRVSAQNPGMHLCLALNYSGREEIVRTIHRLVDEVRQGTLDPAAIDEQAVSDRVDTAGLPDPDLLIRTAGEHRISNFLLWQIAYAELYVTETAWPDFSPDVLHEAILDYSRRDRRFGGLHPDQR